MYATPDANDFAGITGSLDGSQAGVSTEFCDTGDGDLTNIASSVLATGVDNVVSQHPFPSLPFPSLPFPLIPVRTAMCCSPARVGSCLGNWLQEQGRLSAARGLVVLFLVSTPDLTLVT